MKWMVTGAAGMLGSDLVRLLEDEREEVAAFAKDDLDVTDAEEVSARVAEHRPDVIVNCAAFTRVDDCEEHEELACRINGEAVQHLAVAADRQGSLLVQVSTDFVFDGNASRPYETDDSVAPLSAYGRSKLAGEWAAAGVTGHQILRTSWLFGRGGWNFVEAIRRQVDLGRPELRVVDDQRGRPTFTPHLALAIVALARRGAEDSSVRGVFHYADEPDVTWHGFATAIIEELRRSGTLQQDVIVHPVTTEEFPRPARRPAWSVLSTKRWESVTGLKPSDWRGGLRRYLDPHG